MAKRKRIPVHSLKNGRERGKDESVGSGLRTGDAK